MEKPTFVKFKIYMKDNKYRFFVWEESAQWDLTMPQGPGFKRDKVKKEVIPSKFT